MAEEIEALPAAYVNHYETSKRCRERVVQLQALRRHRMVRTASHAVLDLWLECDRCIR